MSSPHQVYSRSLPRDHGCPLWIPEPRSGLRASYQQHGLKIGDVGVVSPDNGSFDVWFNITLPHDEQPYPELVPENFTRVVLDQERDLDPQPHALPAHEVISSTSVKLISCHEDPAYDQTPSRYAIFP